jgi:hypothetical protein
VAGLDSENGACVRKIILVGDAGRGIKTCADPDSLKDGSESDERGRVG